MQKDENLDYYLCPKCANGDYIDITAPEIFIICDRCGYRDSYVRCNNCSVEGSFVKNITHKPHQWVCDYCNTNNKLNNNFYKNSVRIPDLQKMKKRNVEKNKKINSYKSTLIYLVLYCISFITVPLDDSVNFNIWTPIQLLGFTSCVFIAGYLGLKLNSFRFSENTRLRTFSERLNVSKRIIIIHICIIFVSIGIVPLTTETISDSGLQIEPVDSELIEAIEKEFSRTDISKIVQVGDRYLVYFSDESMEVFESTSK
ncbi:hypothetical protein R9X47_13830 [Wukongibacter baidiensis]|uniref:hypothetical protein n=1 Tax=Wukongibacter baidiensis TaxID=1723361 RepID=UPI003D7FB991